MAEWNPYNSYWQYPYTAQMNYDYSHGTSLNAQTFDYNHQTAPTAATTMASVSTPPPPPGIDRTDGCSIPESSSVSNSLPNSGCWTTPPNSSASLMPYGYPCATSGHPQSQVPRPTYPEYSMPPSPWLQPYYAYPPYQQPNMFTSYQGWSYPPPYSGVSAPVTGVGDASATTQQSIGNTPTTFGSPLVTGTESLQETPAALKAKGTKEQWSDELKDYVQRAFCSIDTTEEKDQMERILKEKLEYIFRNNIKIDWTKENIPTIPSKTLAACRNAAAIRPSSVNVVRPVHLFTGLRSARSSGGNLRLPVGVLTRFGGRGGDLSSSASGAGGPTKSADRAVAAAAAAAAAINRKIAAASASAKSPVMARSRGQNQSPRAAARAARKRSEQVIRRSYSRSRSRSSLSSRSRDSRFSSRSSSPASAGGDHDRRRSRSRHRRPRSVSRSRSRSGSRKLNTRYYNAQRSPPARGSGPKRGRGARGASRNTNQRGSSPDRSENTSPNAAAAASNFSGYVRGAARGSGGRGAARRGRKQRNAATFVQPGTSDFRLSQRANRFKDHLNETSVLSSGPGTIARTTSQVLLNCMGGDDRDDLTADFAACQIVGTSQDLEKPYLRLTRAPEPGEVRPLNVLKLALEHVKKRLTEKKDYRWVCEQFKSIRQDITVQCIEDDFAARVYETHADAALDAGDFEEFHQCQSQLQRLYKDGLASARLLEFTAYRLLYYIFTIDQLGITTILAGLRPAHKSNPSIRFALDVRSAWSLSNYRRFFHLICPPPGASQPPLRCGQVVQWFIGRERKEALKTIFKVYRPNISLQYVAETLGFDAVDECRQFIAEEFELSADLLEPLEKLDCKTIWGAVCDQTTAS